MPEARRSPIVEKERPTQPSEPVLFPEAEKAQPAVVARREKPSPGLLGHPVTMVIVAAMLLYVGVTNPTAGIIILAVVVVGAVIGLGMHFLRR